MDLNVVLGLARAEMRLIRRLVRFWVFAALAALIMGVLYFFYGLIHGLASAHSPTVGGLNPKYLGAALGFWFLAIFAIGLVLLTYDVRARDQRERVAEVLDTRPVSNFELLFGRFLGTLVVGMMTLMICIGLMQLVGWLAETLGWLVGATMEPYSIVNLLLFQALPAFAFIIAFVYLTSLLVRNRAVTAILVLVVLGAISWFSFQMPIAKAQFLDLLGILSLVFPSEMFPILPDMPWLVQRFGLLLGAAGLLLLASVVHPRFDDAARRPRLVAGAVLAAMPLLVSVWMASRANAEVRLKDAWRDAHQAVRSQPAPDFQSVSGTVSLRPGRDLTAELEIELAASDRPLPELRMTLNPGLEVTSVAAVGGGELPFEHANGLLTVRLPGALAQGESRRISLAYSGVPASEFAFLDSAIDPREVEASNSQIYLLGAESVIFGDDFVGLLPGSRWLPMSGADVGRDAPGGAPRDAFELDLEVEVPEGWLPAVAGARKEVSGAAAGRARYRFAPGAPLPEAALVAGRFQQRTGEAAGVQLELLTDAAHEDTIELLSEAGEEILTWAGERLAEAEDLGLGYAYDGLTLVQVPPPLRGFGGGWRLDSTMFPPGMVMLRETGLPTARFDNRFRNRASFEEGEGGVPRAMRRALEGYFENDFSGGNPFLGLVPNFFGYLTAARGPDSLALGYVTESLTQQLISDREGYFSAHLFRDAQTTNATFGAVFIQGVGGIGGDGGNKSLAQVLTETNTRRAAVWDRALDVSLADLDPENDPAGVVDVLVLKGRAMARSILDQLGRRKAAEMLAELRRRHRGGSFDRQDLQAAATAVGADLGTVLEDWLDSTELPAFVASAAEVYRLADREDGSPRYQVRVKVRNDGDAPGLIRLEYRSEEDDSTGWQSAEAVRFEGGESLELGLVTGTAPTRLRLAPYLAINRGPFVIDLPAADHEAIREEEAFRGSRAVDWSLATRGVVVDDLSDGFSTEAEKGRGFRLVGRGQATTGLDQGLPEIGPPVPPQQWSRMGFASGYGRYRHTIALVAKGQGKRKAIFTAELPRAGRWRLDLHLPAQMTGPTGAMFILKDYNLTLTDASGSQQIEFDAEEAGEGWNPVGEYDVARGEVRVELSDETTGTVVIADAIRWRPDRRSAAADTVSEENGNE